MKWMKRNELNEMKWMKTNSNGLKDKRVYHIYATKYTLLNISERLRKENISQNISKREAVDWKGK